MGSLKKMAEQGQQPVIFNAELWAKEIVDAKNATKPSEEETKTHFARIERWTLLFGAFGTLLAAQGCISPLSMVLLCLCYEGRFAIIAHHSLHGGMGVSRRGWFAKGTVRRILDWLDWILPEAWVVEHNKNHHYVLNEDSDPDKPDRNTAFIQGLQIPLVLKYFIMFLTMASWKWYYYASNTLKLLHKDEEDKPKDFEAPIVMDRIIMEALSGKSAWYRRFALDFAKVMAPPLIIPYFLFPMVVGLIHGSDGMLPYCWYALANIAGAETLANLHQFATIVTNHAGRDLWTFNDPCKADTPEFILRAVLASTAYHAGTDVIDYLHGYLNYQAEHHSFPALSPLHYQRLHPHFKRICAHHGVPYIQENVFLRVWKTVNVAMGVDKMPRLVGDACAQPELWAVTPQK